MTCPPINGFLDLLADVSGCTWIGGDVHEHEVRRCNYILCGNLEQRQMQLPSIVHVDTLLSVFPASLSDYGGDTIFHKTSIAMIGTVS